MPVFPPRGGLMACPANPDQCRTAHIAAKLRDTTKDGTDWEARCPVCGHGGFRISHPDAKRLRHVWTCNCKRCKCDRADMRAALLGLGILPTCLGIYATEYRTRTDPMAAARLESTVREILAVPGLKPSDMRIILAEALGDKVPTDSRSFVQWAIGIGIGRRQAFEAAARWCRPADTSSLPGGGVADA